MICSNTFSARLAAAAFGMAVIAVPQTADATERANIMRVEITSGGDNPLSRELLLPLDKAAIIELPADANDVLMSNPEIADAIIRTPRRVYVLGMEVGQTNAFFFDADGDLILNLEIRVERDIAAVQDMINRLMPEARVTVEALNDNLVVTGVVSSNAEADRAIAIANRFVDDPENVLSLLQISGNEQVMLQVRVVEMQRTVVRQLGINLNGTTHFGEFTPNLLSTIPNPDTGLFNIITPGSFTNSSTLSTDNSFGVAGQSLGGLAAGITANNFVDGVLQSTVGASLSALERVGLVRTLAEPNLTAITGEAAEFLAGGEFPVPVGRDREGNIIIEYKPFGVGLSFTPMVLSEGRISLYISTEVSELTSQGALTLDGGVIDTNGDGIPDATIPGLTLPALNVRRAESTVELPSGGSMVIAGLIQDRQRQSVDSVPGLDDLPGVGALFRTRDFDSVETELVVVVTPYLVDPVATGSVQLPDDGYRNATPAEEVFFGRLNSVYQAPGADVGGRRWLGPVGFIFDHEPQSEGSGQ